MPNNANKRTVLTVFSEVVIAGSLGTMSFLTVPLGLPSLANLISNIGISWMANLSGEAFRHLLNCWLGKDEQLKGGVANALAEALQTAVTELQPELEEYDAYKRLQYYDLETAKLLLANLITMGNNATQIMLVRTQPQANILALMQGDRSQLSVYLEQIVENDFSGHESELVELVEFLQKRLATLWLHHFEQILRNSSTLGTQAWRECQQLWQESLTQTLNQTQLDVAEIKKAIFWLKALAEQQQVKNKRDRPNLEAVMQVQEELEEHLNNIEQNTTPTSVTNEGLPINHSQKPSTPHSRKVKMSDLSPDDLLAQATCAVIIEDQIAGTAWLVSDQGHLLTAGHLLGQDKPLSEVKVRFEDGTPQTAHQVSWVFESEKGIDFAVLQLNSGFDNRYPLPISLARSVTDKFTLRGYGQTLADPATGMGEFVGVVDRQSSPNYRLFRLSCKELAEPGFSGGAVYSEQIRAVVAIQIEAGKNRIGTTSDTVLAMPLYRMTDYWKPLQDMATIEPPPDTLPKPPLDTPPRLPFVNRQEELNRILSPLAPPYHLIDAPAGYGKTALLKELKDQFEKQNWLCAYVSVQKDRTVQSITHTLAAELQVSLTQDDSTRNLGENLAKMLVQQRRHEFSSQEKGKKGVILFIDIDRRRWDSMQPTINSLFTNFIPDMEEALHSLDFFQKGHNRFRVVFAGRYLAGKTPRRTPFRLSLQKLTHFNYEVVRDTVKAYLPRQRDIAQLTAHLMHITAGHPGVIARVLKLYQERGVDSPDDFFRHYADEIWVGIVWPESDAIRNDIDSELRRIFDNLTVFRYLNESVLQDLLEQIRPPKYRDAFNLADVLTGAYLMNWEARLLRDSLTRGLLVRRFLREIGTNAFGQHCLRAQNICVTYLQDPSAQMPEKWMIELLFQYLQQHISDIESPQKRSDICQNFFANAVPSALRLLVSNRTPRQQQRHLKRALEEDSEFHFTVNYYLREDIYNNDPYTKLESEIDNLFDQLI